MPRRRSALAVLFAAALIALPAAARAQAWDREENIDRAMAWLAEVQYESGTRGLIEATRECYAEAEFDIGLTPLLEACVAMDAALSDWDSGYHAWMADRMDDPDYAAQQPGYTRPEAMQDRALGRLMASGFTIPQAEAAFGAIRRYAVPAAYAHIRARAERGEPEEESQLAAE